MPNTKQQQQIEVQLQSIDGTPTILSNDEIGKKHIPSVFVSELHSLSSVDFISFSNSIVVNTSG